MKITKEFLERVGAIPFESGYKLRLMATNMVLRINADKCYCELPGLYVGEITFERLHTLYHGLTGQSLANLLSEEERHLHYIIVGNYNIV